MYMCSTVNILTSLLHAEIRRALPPHGKSVVVLWNAALRGQLLLMKVQYVKKTPPFSQVLWLALTYHPYLFNLVLCEDREESWPWF